MHQRYKLLKFYEQYSEKSVLFAYRILKTHDYGKERRKSNRKGLS